MMNTTSMMRIGMMNMSGTKKCYSELIEIESFEDRLRYLKLNGNTCEETFGNYRYLNQMLYKMTEWKKTRRQVIIRDEGFDLAHEDHEIIGNIYIHHINPITIDDIIKYRYCLFDLENLISSSFETHEFIHYGKFENYIFSSEIVERKPFDTCPWKIDFRR